MPRKAPRKPPVGNDLMPLPDNPRPLPRKALKPKAPIRSGTKKIGAGPKVAKRTAPRPTKGYR
jgi:hypothetical protein